MAGTIVCGRVHPAQPVSSGVAGRKAEPRQLSRGVTLCVKGRESFSAHPLRRVPETPTQLPPALEKGSAGASNPMAQPPEQRRALVPSREKQATRAWGSGNERRGQGRLRSPAPHSGALLPHRHPPLPQWGTGIQTQLLLPGGQGQGPHRGARRWGGGEGAARAP